MFIQPYYHISVTKSFAEMPGTSGVVFGGRANFDILNAIARAYSSKSDYLVLLGCVDESKPKKAYYHGDELIPVCKGDDIQFYCTVHGLLETLKCGEDGFYLV